MEGWMEVPRMPSRKCKACHQVLDAIWFQEPIQSCLYCYSRLPTNRDLWEVIDTGDPVRAGQAWRRLRERASRAPYAKSGKSFRRKRRSELMELGEHGLDNPIPAQPSPDVQ